MSRVDPKPRYVCKTLQDALCLVSHTGNTVAFERIRDLVGDPMSANWTLFPRAYSIGVINLLDRETAEHIIQVSTQLDSWDDINLAQCRRYVVAKSRLGLLRTHAVNAAFGNVVVDLVNTINPDTIHTDFVAACTLFEKFLNREIEVEDDWFAPKVLSCCREILIVQAHGQNLSYGEMSNLCMNSCLMSRPSDNMRYYYSAANAMDVLWSAFYDDHINSCHKVLLHPIPRSRRLKEFAQRYAEYPVPERFINKNPTLNKLFKDMIFYCVRGVVVILRGKEMYLLDRDLIHSLRTRVRGLFNLEVFTRDRYKQTCSEEFCKTAMRIDARVIRYMKDRLRVCRGKRRMLEQIAHEMHISYNAYLASAFEPFQKMKVNTGDKVLPLIADAEKIAGKGKTLYHVFANTKYPSRLVLDAMKLHHLMPNPDIDPLAMTLRLQENMQCENEYDKEELKTFMMFCKSFDAARYAAEYRKVPALNVSPDNPCAEHIIESATGRFTMPPKSEWGKAYIEKHFNWSRSADFWPLLAQDVTHVGYPLSCLEDVLHSPAIQECNELLYAMTHGFSLSNGKNARENRETVWSGQWNEVVPVITAGKSEGTKYGDRSRETHSAVDVFRELQSEVEQNFRQISSWMPGSVLRTPPHILEHRMHELSVKTTTTAVEPYLITSQDISKWSPKMPRAVFYTHYRYLCNMFDAEGASKMTTMWDKLRVICKKQSKKVIFDAHGGNFQGFPGTHDTIMHCHILSYITSTARLKGILSAQEASHMFALIDDALYGTQLKTRGKYVDLEQKATALYKHMISTYKKLGFEVDAVKTFYSSSFFVFLNKIFACGCEVILPLKTCIKLDREWTARFPSVFVNTYSFFGASYGAIKSGASAGMCYTYSLIRSLQYLYHRCPDAFLWKTASIAFTALAPRSVGGWSLPTLMSWSTNEMVDSLSEYYALVCAYAQLNCPVQHLEIPASIFYGEPAQVRKIFLAKEPTRVTHVGVIESSGIVRHELVDSLKSLNLVPPFSNIEAFEGDKDIENALTLLFENRTLEPAVISASFENTPYALMDELLTRATCSEQIPKIMSPTDRRNLLRRIRAIDRSQVCLLSKSTTIKVASLKAFMEMCISESSIAIASVMRDKFYARNNCNFVNHTAPPALFSITRSDPNDREGSSGVIRFRYKSMRTPSDCNEVNFAQCYFLSGAFYGHYTSGVILENTKHLASINPVLQRFISGVNACAYADATGVDSYEVARLFVSTWTRNMEVPIDVITSGTHVRSVKQMGTFYGSRKHPYVVSSNASGLISVDIKSFDSVIGQSFMMHDVFSHLVCIKSWAMYMAMAHWPEHLPEMKIRVRLGYRLERTLPPRSNMIIDGWEAALASITPFTENIPDLAELSAVFNQRDALEKLIVAYKEGGEKLMSDCLSNISTTSHEQSPEDVIIIRATSTTHKHYTTRQLFKDRCEVEYSKLANVKTVSEDCPFIVQSSKLVVKTIHEAHCSLAIKDTQYADSQLVKEAMFRLFAAQVKSSSCLAIQQELLGGSNSQLTTECKRVLIRYDHIEALFRALSRKDCRPALSAHGIFCTQPVNTPQQLHRVLGDHDNVYIFLRKWVRSSFAPTQVSRQAYLTAAKSRKVFSIADKARIIGLRAKHNNSQYLQRADEASTPEIRLVLTMKSTLWGKVAVTTQGNIDQPKYAGSVIGLTIANIGDVYGVFPKDNIPDISKRDDWLSAFEHWLYESYTLDIPVLNSIKNTVQQVWNDASDECSLTEVINISSDVTIANTSSAQIGQAASEGPRCLQIGITDEERLEGVVYWLAYNIQSGEDVLFQDEFEDCETAVELLNAATEKYGVAVVNERWGILSDKPSVAPWAIEDAKKIFEQSDAPYVER